MEMFRKKGVSAEFDADGRIWVESKSHRNKVMAAFPESFTDHDGGYADPVKSYPGPSVQEIDRVRKDPVLLRAETKKRIKKNLGPEYDQC